MALTYDQISAITQKKFIPKLADSIFDTNPLTKRLKEKSYEKVDGGLSIMQPLNYAMTSASGWYTGNETLSTSDNEQFSAAEYSWKQLYTNITITGLDEAKNAGDSQILNLVKSKTQIAEKTMKDKLGTGIYSNGTTDPKSIVGLRAIAASISSSVGGISQTDYTWWRPQLDSSTTVLSLAAMQSRYNACAVDNDAPTVISTTRSIYNTFWGLLQPQQRFQDSDSAKAGFSSLMFNGAPVIADSYCPSLHMFFLNEKYLHLYAHKDRDMKFEAFQKPVNQDLKTAKIYWMGALGSSNNRLHGAMTAIAG